jgi:hypothetical protein
VKWTLLTRWNPDRELRIVRRNAADQVRIQSDAREDHGMLHDVAAESGQPDARRVQQLSAADRSSRHDDCSGGDGLRRTTRPRYLHPHRAAPPDLNALNDVVGQDLGHIRREWLGIEQVVGTRVPQAVTGAPSSSRERLNGPLPAESLKSVEAAQQSLLSDAGTDAGGRVQRAS